MRFTEKDVPICKMIFNEATHEMGMLMYQERAREIYKFICDTCLDSWDFFEYKVDDSFAEILIRKPTASFFFDNNLIDFDCFNRYNIQNVLILSPIVKRVWDSGKLDSYLYRLDDWNIQLILEKSPIADKIKESGKLKIYE